LYRLTLELKFDNPFSDDAKRWLAILQCQGAAWGKLAGENMSLLNRRAIKRNGRQGPPVNIFLQFFLEQDEGLTGLLQVEVDKNGFFAGGCIVEAKNAQICRLKEGIAFAQYLRPFAFNLVDNRSLGDITDCRRRMGVKRGDLTGPEVEITGLDLNNIPWRKMGGQELERLAFRKANNSYSHVLRFASYILK